MKRALLLLGARTYRAADFLAAARRLDVELIVGSDREDVLTGQVPARSLGLDFLKPERATAEIVALHRTRPLDAVLAVDDTATVLAARASAAIGLPASPAESVVSAGHKRVFREICLAAGLSQPWFREISLREDARRLAPALEYPCVIKPLHLSASRGVIRCDDPEQFEAAFRRLAALLARPEIRRRDEALAERALVEGYLPGDEVALEGLVIDGRFELLALWDKPEPLTGPFFQESLFVTPSRHSQAVQEQALQSVRRAAAALGLRMGPVHAEARVDGDRVTLLELAPRSIGGHCGRALRFTSGVTLEELILAQALGLAPAPPVRERAAAGVMMIPIPRAGTFRVVGGVDAARTVKGIEDVDIVIPAGQPIEPPPEGDRYLGFIFARGGTPHGVEGALRQAHGRLRIEIDPSRADEASGA